MAPLWKVMLSKSSPLYRDSLFSFSLWEWKAQERELLLLKKHTDRERRAMLTQLDKLSKELQQKDKVIESLRARLNQHQQHHHPHRSDTPCSGHALSDTTDQSDRISYVSDEHGSTIEDLELCSDVDAASELGQDESRTSAKVSTDCHHGTVSRHPSIPPSITSSHRTQSCHSCSSMQSTSSQHTGMQSQTGFSTPQAKPLQGFPFVYQQPDSFDLLPLSYQGLQPSPFSSAASNSSLDASLTMKAGASLLESSALWDVSYGNRAVRTGADLSSGSSGYQSGNSHTGSDLMKEHLREIRSLRQRLEDSIHTNDRLRQQLEEKLARTTTEKGAPTNIYIQGLESVNQLASEIRLLKEENVSLQNQLKQVTKESTKEAEQLREVALQERSRVKEVELEAEKWAEQTRKLQTEAEAQSQEILHLKQDRLRNQETINRLQHELTVLRQQLCESRSLVHSLQCELQVYRKKGRVTTNAPTGQGSDSTTVFDPKELHIQLEQQLSREADTQPQARRQLFSDSVPSPPVRDTGLFSPSSPLHAMQKHTEETGATDQAASTLHGHHTDGCFYNCHGRHAVGHIDDFKVLQQHILQGSALLLKMETALYSLSTSQEFSFHQLSDWGSVQKLLLDTKTLRQILDEAESLLCVFWRAALPKSEEVQQNQSLREEVLSLRLKLSEQEQALKDTMERVKSSSGTKDSMEHFIVSQLLRTRDVLRKAKTNLQVKSQADASVSSTCLLVGVS